MSPRNDMPLLELRHVSLRLDGRQVLRDVELALLPGEIHALLGANGSGKSSLAYLVMGCGGYRPEHGELLFGGKSIAELPIHERARLGISLAWQEPARFEGLTVAEYLSLGSPKRNAAECLDRVGLPSGEYLARMVDKALSGGERKRIELAALLALGPKLAILDEPTAGVDMLSLGEIIAVVESLRETGSAVLLITHQEELAAHADRASQLCGGRIVFGGPPEEVVAHYKARLCRRCDGETCHD
ncbi:MAG: ATP-binding cassette domain-containing protein [Gallionellaceae bacterium]|nr:ATP-binding cassette domain-containing protein [Gallionellaceae bacterium]